MRFFCFFEALLNVLPEQAPSLRGTKQSRHRRQGYTACIWIASLRSLVTGQV
ncbi:MAG: hypothetical protein LBJ47_10770 [Tannerella sp.]|nr:hypothetical protein [Tannerella sp.]